MNNDINLNTNEEPVAKEKDKETERKVEALKSIIEEAEKSIFSARAMLERLEGVKQPTITKRTFGASPDGKIVEGFFDGQIMIANDGKQYPVPANYASKSKLVEGDMLKLTITDDGSFIYKQIGPVERKHLIGLVSEDESGNFIVSVDGKSYKVLLASITYYKVQPGDEVAIVVPKDGDPIWCSIENITKKSTDIGLPTMDTGYFDSEVQDPFLKKEATIKAGVSGKGSSDETEKSLVDEWTPELADMEKEAPTKVKIKVGSRKKEQDAVVTKKFPDTAEEFFGQS